MRMKTLALSAALAFGLGGMHQTPSLMLDGHTPFAVLANLSGWWEFEEGTGTSSADASGNGNAATLANGATWASGHIGDYAVDCDGANDYVSLADYSQVDDGVFTIAFWVKPNGATADYDFVTKGMHSSASTAVFLIFRDESVSGTADVGGGNTDAVSFLIGAEYAHWIASSSGVLNDTSWHHVAAVAQNDGKTLLLYVDGSLEASNTDATFAGITASSDAIRLCAPIDLSGPLLDGSMDQVYFFDRALSSAEIAALAEGR